jgi:glycerol uptake facilitator-like aquaporin
LFIIGEIEAPAAAAYIVTQFAAAVLGAAIVWGCMADQMLKEEQGGCK